MPIEARVAEAVKKNSGVIPMTEIVPHYWSESGVEYIKTEDDVKIDKEQVRLLFWEACKGELSEERLVHHLEHGTLLELAIFANVCKVFHYRDHAESFTDVMEGRKFCETFAMQILVHPDVRIAVANELHDTAMRVYRKLGVRITELASAVRGAS